MSTSPPRIRLASPTADPDGELPFRILVIADAAGRALEAPLGQRQSIRLGAGGVDSLLMALSPVVAGEVPDRLGTGRPCTFRLPWSGIAGPDHDACLAGITGLEVLERERATAPAVERALLAERIDAQIAAVREHPAMRRMEALWRSLALLAGHAQPGSGVELAVLPATRDELEEDLGDAPDPAGSGLFHTVYHAEYGQHGGRPWALLVTDLRCGPSARDATLLRRLAALGNLAHAPVLADAAPGLLGLAGWSGLADVTDVGAALSGACAQAWSALGQHPDARHAALVVPPPLLRGPLGAADDRLWGLASMVLAARLADCHARSRWSSAAAGSGPEAEVALPAPTPFAAMAGAEDIPTAACLLTEDQARDLAAHALVPLCASRLRPAVAFPAIPSLHRSANPVIDQLPLVMLADRIAHHLKVLQRERLGGSIDRVALERGLSDWLGRHVADGQLADPALRAMRPLRGAEVRVEEVPGRAGWLRAALTIRPHLPGAGADVELALVGRLDREQS